MPIRKSGGSFVPISGVVESCFRRLIRDENILKLFPTDFGGKHVDKNHFQVITAIKSHT